MKMIKEISETQNISSYKRDLCMNNLRHELDQTQFNSLLDLKPSDQQYFVEVTSLMRDDNRKGLLNSCRECNISIEKLITIIRQEQITTEMGENQRKTPRCSVCAWKTEARKIIVRNSNKTEEMARNNVGRWTTVKLPCDFDIFELKRNDDEEDEVLRIYFSKSASDFTFTEPSVINMEHVCHVCRKEIREFVLAPQRENKTGKHREPTKDELLESRALEKRIARWWRSEAWYQKCQDLNDFISSGLKDVYLTKREKEKKELEHTLEEKKIQARQKKEMEYKQLVKSSTAIDKMKKVKTHEKRFQIKAMKLLELFALLHLEREYGNSVNARKDLKDPQKYSILKEFHHESGIPLTKNASSILFGTAVDATEDESPKLSYWLECIKKYMKELEIWREGLKVMEEIAKQQRLSCLKSQWLEAAHILEEKVTCLMKQRREIEETRIKEREKMRRQNRERREEMERKVQLEREENLRLEEQRREMRRKERELELLELQNMRAAEAEQTMIDRFWGFPTAAAEQRKMELWKRYLFEQRVLLLRATMLAVGGEICAEKDETVGDLSNILGIPEYLLRDVKRDWVGGKS